MAQQHHHENLSQHSSQCSVVRLQVRGSSDPNTQAKDIENLRAAATAAEAAGVGLYTTNDALRSSSIFSFDTDTASTGSEALAAFGKGAHRCSLTGEAHAKRCTTLLYVIVRHLALDA